MSALGDYIHFHQKNYLSHGINRVSESPSESWSEAVSAFKQQLNISNEMFSLINESKFLEKQYNDLFYGSQKTSNFSLALQSFVQKKLDQEFGLMAGRFNSNNLSVDKTELYGELKKAIDTARKKIGRINLDKDITLQTFMNKINQIQLLLEQEQFKDIKEVQVKLNQSKKEVNEIAKKVSEMINQSGGKVKLDANDKNIEKISQIIQEFNRTPLLQNQSGNVLEWILPFIKLQSSNLAKQALVQEMEKLSKESVRGDVQIKVEMPDLLDNQLTDENILMDDIKINTVSVRSKTDVIIEYFDKKNNLQKKNVSAKSISGKSIKIVEQTTLYRILLLSQNYRFATHYLNVITGSSKGGWGNITQIYQANRLIKGLAFKLGAQGYDLNNSSQLLIVNNKKQSYIYVYNLKVLIYLIQKAMVEQGKYTNLISNLSDSYKINQSFQKDGPETRILKIIRETQNVKITAKLTGSGLNQYLKLL